MTTPSTADVRNWARSHGFTVADRGRLSPEIMAAYSAATGDGGRATSPAGAGSAPDASPAAAPAGQPTANSAARPVKKGAAKKGAAKKGAAKKGAAKSA